MMVFMLLNSVYSNAYSFEYQSTLNFDNAFLHLCNIKSYFCNNRPVLFIDDGLFFLNFSAIKDP